MSSPTETPAFRLRRADWDRDRDALRTVRLSVFVREQGVPEDLEWDDADAAAIHLIALAGSGEEPVGTARLLPTAQIGRMAVLPEWRGRGIGTALLRELVGIARQTRQRAPFLHAQVSALPFYLRAGFVPVGEVFEEAGIPHQRMELHDAPSARPDPPMGQRQLHRDAGVLVLDGRASIRAAGIQMAAQAGRGLCLLTRDLDPVLYDDPAFVAAVRHLAVHRRDLPVRILVFEAGPVVQHGHRLLPLIHQLTSRIAVRRVSESQQGRLDAFLVADQAGYILRPQADIYQATADFYGPLQARRLRADFESLWAQAESSPELRRLHL